MAVMWRFTAGQRWREASPAYLGALVGRVGSGVGEDEPRVLAELHGAVIAVVLQFPPHRAEVHGGVDDVQVVLG